jgi:hypothetical protein
MSNLVWVASGLAAISMIAWLLYLASKGRRYSLEELRRPVIDLLTRGYDQGLLTIQHTRSSHFVQFRKYVRAPNDNGIELVFPESRWSQSYFGRFHQRLVSEGISFGIAQERDDNPMRFLYIDLGKNIDQSMHVLTILCNDVFAFNADDRFYVLLQNASAQSEVETGKTNA